MSEQSLNYSYSEINNLLNKASNIDAYRKSDGGNYDADLIVAAAALYSLFLAANTSYFSSSKIYYDGDSCAGILTTSAALSAGTSYTVGTLPSGYRPAAAFSDVDSTGNTIAISTAGVVTITPAAAIASGTALRFYADY